MLTGQYLHTLDAKGRVFVPAKFRADLQGELVIVRGLDDCLVLYNREQWEAFIKKLETYGEMQMKRIKRFILASAFNTELDSQGRIVISQELRSHAGIEKDISFVGLNNCVEIWRPDKFAEINDDSDIEEMKEMLKNVGF
ncbi:MAG: division/cell wall cluster transcriptional repressor MraZ [Clostridia bacterium]|nr:division/cell wall cluster transcriptional repressor MraZ [Clostridia bacterium]